MYVYSLGRNIGNESTLMVIESVWAMKYKTTQNQILVARQMGMPTILDSPVCVVLAAAGLQLIESKAQ